MNSNPRDLSNVRQNLHRLSVRHKELLDKIIDIDRMVMGSVFEVYKTCTKPNCRCQRGEKHGPFVALSYSRDGKVRHKVVRENDRMWVTEQVGTYKTFQKTRKFLRQIQRDINKLLDALKEIQIKEYR